jgi:hypothetical protein
MTVGVDVELVLERYFPVYVRGFFKPDGHEELNLI